MGPIPDQRGGRARQREFRGPKGGRNSYDVAMAVPASRKIDAAALLRPAVYTPFDSGVYKVSAGFSGLARTFGNGDAYAKVFQIDSDFFAFRENIRALRSEDRFEKYHRESEAFSDIRHNVLAFIVERLCKEYPDHFSFSKDGREIVVECSLTNETIRIDRNYELVSNDETGYGSAFDALASQVQEDLAVVRVDEKGDRVVALHVTAPNYWDPSEKLDKSFVEVHEPVAGIGTRTPKAEAMMRAMTRDVRYQRFVWGLTTDRRLNHHPVQPEGFAASKEEWHGRRFDPDNPELYIRVERQVIIGFQEVSAFLFCIRPHFVDCAKMTPELRASLRIALQSMSPESRVYKRLDGDFDAIVKFLEA